MRLVMSPAGGWISADDTAPEEKGGRKGTIGSQRMDWVDARELGYVRSSRGGPHEPTYDSRRITTGQV